MMVDFETLLRAMAPEVLLAGAGLIGVLAGAILSDRFTTLSFRLGAVVLFLAAMLAALHWEGGGVFNGLAETGPFVNFAKVVSYASAGIALLMAEGFLRRHGTQRYEYSLLMLFAALGIGIILSSANLMTLYLGIEMLSLSSYVLASFHRDSARSAEAGLKYFILGALASGLLLYGMSLVYGFAGGTDYQTVAEAEPTLGLLFGMVLMITGLGFKVSAAPMHVWTPDVYEGAPSPVVAFFATAPKMAAMVVFAVIMFKAFPQLEAVRNWQAIIGIIAAASMLIGAFGALLQTNLKRLLGYSSIANMGYALVALAAGAELGGGALLLFMTAYVVASLGLFGGVLCMHREGGMVENIHELSGLVRYRPALTLALSVLVISVAGFPLAFGFLGKLAVVEAGLAAGLLPLIVTLILSSVIAFGYYLRLILIMWVREPAEPFEPVDGWVTSTVFATALLSVALFIFVSPLSELAERAAASLI